MVKTHPHPRKASRQSANAGAASTRNPITPVVTLASQRWRQHWLLLALICIGMIASIVIACSVPLLSQTMLTGSVRNVLRATPTSSEISIHAQVGGLSTPSVQQISEVVDQPFAQYLRPYLKGHARYDIQTPRFNIFSPKPPASSDQISFYGSDPQADAAHVKLLQGRLPRSNSSVVEIAVDPNTAQLLNLHVGTQFVLNWTYYNLPAGFSVASGTPPTPVYMHFVTRVVGIFSVQNSDPFWHGQNFLPETTFSGFTTYYTALVSEQAFLAALDKLAVAENASQVFFFNPSFIYWYYNLDPSRISVSQLGNLVQQLTATQNYFTTNFSDPSQARNPPYIQQFTVSGDVLPVGGVPSILDKFHTQLAVAQIPAAILAIGILALLLFFISIMAGLLVERQSDGIVLLRSRGASRSQILGAFMTQSVVLGIIALVIGTPLAVFAGYLLAQRLLPPNAQDAINTITNAPMQALLSVKWYALAAVLIGVVTMFLALYRASRADVWATGRTHTASTQRPLWQRLNLDFFALVIAIAGYAISSYLTDIEQLLDPQTQQLVVTPLALLAPVFLLLAIVLLFLRFFPYLLHLFSVLVMRRQGAAPMLAVAQMARAPRQSLRMILLLSLATAFAIFALVFSATQAQRAQDIAAYQAGADFSGDIPTNAVNHYALAQETALYRGIPGVTSASVGYIEDDASSATNIAAFPIELRAVDPATYAQSSLWTAQDSAQPIAPLLAQLAAQRGSAIQNELIPAIVDSSTWDTLNLHIGSTFTLYKSTTPGNFVRYVVLAEVQHVPGLNSSDNGGIIVDYQSFLAIEAHKGYAAIIDNHVWLNTSGSPAALSRVRAELNTPALQLDNLYDRRALAASLQQDPLALNILGLLALGATAALLLALIGDLLASWLSVRQRLTNFTVLRALGADRRQIASVLAWEQAIVYVVTLLLGILFGALLALTIVPALIFTSLPIGQAANYITTDAFFAVQRIIPINIIVSPTLLIGFAVLVITCFGALSMMIRIVLHSSMTQVLRLDENQSSAFFAREDTFLARTLPHQVASGTGRRASRSLRPSIVTLALWQLREARFLLLMEGIGIIAAVVIVCMVPLFSTVAATTGLHDTLNASPSTAEITLDTTTQGISTAVFNGVRRQINPVMQQSLGQYLSQATPYLLNSTGYMLTPSSPATAKDQVQLVSTSLDQAAPHIRLLQGQLPQAAFSNGQIDALLSPATAQALHVTVGSLLHLRCDFFTNPQDMFGGNNPSGTLTLRVAGLFAVAGNASFWHDRDFQPVTNDNGTTFPIFVPDSAFLAAADQLASAAHAQTVFSPETFDLAWYYHLNPAAITSAQVSDLITRLNQLQTTVANKYGNLQSLISLGNAPPPPYLVQVNLYNPVQGEYALPTTLDSYRNRSTALSIPVAVLTLQIFALIVFFISLIANLLVDRQAEAVAITRSRGASSGQIFGALLAQSVVLGIVALIAGPLLAVFVVSTAARSLLGSGSQGAPALLVGQPLQSALSVGWYAAVTVLVVIIIMAALLWRASGTSVVSIRRQSARTTQRPLWQRLNLDVVAAIVAIVGYGISIYLASIGNLLDARTKVLVAAPLTLIAPLFLLLAALILFLRFFTTILQFAAKLTVRRKGATSMLALAQMSRAPRQSVRMTMLLALAVAFAIFTLVFSASQSQHIASLASYESGADFSGDLVVTPLHPSVQRETALYRAIPGVTSATVGFTSSGTASGTTLIIPMQVLAVDAQNFAQTAIWSSQDSSQSLSSLMNALLHDRANAVKADVVPAVIDMLTAQRLNLHNGNFFSMSIDGLPDNTLSCVVIAIVQHIPNVNDSNAPGTASYIPPGGVLVDYSTYAAVYKTDALVNGNGSSTALPINHVWLRSGSSPAAVASVRAALASTRLQLTNLYDRRALIDSMLSDPLYLSLVIILTIGAVTALLLTLVGNLLASWLNVRIRLTNFAVLRALGASPVQVTGVLIWEQVVIYATALLLGVVFGAIISFTAISTLAFTSVPATGVLSSISSDEFYALQYVLPAQIVLPLSLVLAFVALVVVCILALGTMAVVVLRPSMSQTLRLNED